TSILWLIYGSLLWVNLLFSPSLSDYLLVVWLIKVPFV
ncbi:hypothetical protein TorRG33x02_229210, partial [Trema orientale]